VLLILRVRIPKISNTKKNIICAFFPGLAVGIALCLNWGLAFVITKFFSNFVILFGIGPTFWIFTGFCIAGALFVFFFQPETKGKSLSAIQRMLAGRETETATATA
jgi:hypothetical protein